MSEALIEYETLDSDQIDDIMEGMPPRPPQRPSDDPGAGGALLPAMTAVPLAAIDSGSKSDRAGRPGMPCRPVRCSTGLPLLSSAVLLVCGDRDLALDRVAVMGVLNLTPDSFSDGGELLTDDERLNADALLRRADVMVAEGAAVLDLGAESTRPGASRCPWRSSVSA